MFLVKLTLDRQTADFQKKIQNVALFIFTFEECNNSFRKPHT
jgi:hypothetical protein